MIFKAFGYKKAFKKDDYILFVSQANPRKKADLMAADLDGDNALMMAISQNHLEIEPWIEGNWAGKLVESP